MSEIDETPRTYSGALLAAIAVALLAAIGGLVWCMTLNSKIGAQQADLTEAQQQNAKLAADQRETAALAATAEPAAKSRQSGE